MTTILRKEKDGLFLYRGERDYLDRSKWPTDASFEKFQRSWFLSCERSGNRWGVHPDEEEKFRPMLADIYSKSVTGAEPTPLEFLSTGVQIPNDCYEIRRQTEGKLRITDGMHHGIWQSEFAYFKSPEQSQENLKQRSRDIELLEKYSLFLEKNGYLDTDWRTEPPFAIDEFLRS